jgi:Tfp pilus assembly protein PilF
MPNSQGLRSTGSDFLIHHLPVSQALEIQMAQMAKLGLIFSLLFASQANAQITSESLIGSAVEKLDDRYRDVDDAIVLFQRGNGSGALTLLRTARSNHPELPPAEIMFAQLCFVTGNAQPGHRALEGAVVSSRQDPEAWNMLADLQLREGHLAEAEVLFQKALTVATEFNGNPRRKQQQLINANAGVALTFERRGEWQAAEPYLRAWLQLEPKNSETMQRLAAVLVNTKRFDEAYRILSAQRELDPEQLPPEITLALVYQRLGMQEESYKSIQKAIDLAGREFAAWIAIARWGLQANDLKLARDCAAKALEITPSSIQPELILGMADLLEGQYAAGEQHFRKVNESTPSDFDANNGLALALLAQPDQQKHKQALGYAELNAKTSNDLRTARGRQAASVLAWALFKAGKTQEAGKLIEAALVSGQVSAETGYFAAAILSDLNKKDLARNVLAKALSEPRPFVGRADAEELLKSLDKESPSSPSTDALGN